MNRIARWVGGSFLTGALALASSGATVPQQRTRASAPESKHGDCGLVDETAVLDTLDDALDNLDVQLIDADLALDESALALEAQQQALEAVQESQEQGEGASVHFFSSSDAPGWLGIRMEEISSAKAKELNLPAERGVLVTSVTEDSPAAKAGLKAGDVISEFDGQRVEGTLTLQRLVREVPAGRKVALSVWRDGRAQSLTVEIGSRRALHTHGDDYFYIRRPDFDIPVPPLPEIAPLPPIEIGPFSTFRMFGAPALGIDAEDLSGQLGNYFGAPDGQGILIREVMPGLPAEKAGLKAGDVILRIDGKRVKDASELRAAVREKLSKAADSAEPGKTVAPIVEISILRSGKESTVRVQLDPPVKQRVRASRRVAV